MIAVGLVTAALLLASTEAAVSRSCIGRTMRSPRWVSCRRPWASRAPAGAFGVLFAKTKREWLEGRLLTERMRQFHFQTFVALMPDILDASRSRDWDAFTAKRGTLLDKFKKEVIGRKSSLFTAIVEGDEQDVWLIQPADLPRIGGRPRSPDIQGLPVFQDRAADPVHGLQIEQRTQAVLRRCRGPVRQSGVGGDALRRGLVTLHILIALGAGFRATEYLYAFHLAAIWFAILALSIRTLEEGLRRAGRWSATAPIARRCAASSAASTRRLRWRQDIVR